MTGRVVAAIVAALLVAGGLVIRSSRDSGSDTERLVWCEPELAAACDGLDGEVRSIAAPVAFDLLVAAPTADSPDVWVTIDPWPAMVDGARRRAGRAALFDTVSPAASTPLTWVVWTDRAEPLTASCGIEPSWTCLVDAETWSALGGPAGWGPITAGHADPASTGSGVIALAGVAGDLLGLPYSANEVTSLDTVRWLRDAVDLVPDYAPPQGDPLSAMLQIGPASYSMVLAPTAVTDGAIAAATARVDQLMLLAPASPLDVVAVVAGADGRDAVRDRLVDDGWTATDERSSLDPGVLETTWSTWEEQT